jgi:hypothetical protein
MEPSVRAASAADDLIFRDVTKLEIGDVIAAPWLPLRRPGRVLYGRPFERAGESWVFVAYVTDTGMHDSTCFLASEGVRLLYAADPTGLTYGRDPEADPQPAAGRVPPHFESGRGAPFDEPGRVHHNRGEEFTACGLVALNIPVGHGLISVREHVTCVNCVTEMRR